MKPEIFQLVSLLKKTDRITVQGTDKVLRVPRTYEIKEVEYNNRLIVIHFKHTDYIIRFMFRNLFVWKLNFPAVMNLPYGYDKNIICIVNNAYIEYLFLKGVK